MNIYKVSRINSHLKQVSNYLIPVPVPIGFQKLESGTSLVLDPMLSIDCMIKNVITAGESIQERG